MEPGTDEFKAIDDLYNKNVAFVREAQARSEAAMLAKHPQAFGALRECRGMMDSYRQALMANQVGKANTFLANVALCMGAFYGSKYFKTAKECLRKYGVGSEKCDHIFQIIAADVADIQDKRGGTVPLPVRRLEDAVDQRSAALFSKGVPEEQVGVARLAFIMKDYCGGSMSAFVSCSKRNRFNSSKCKREAEGLLDCYNGFESMKLEAQLYAPQSK